METGTKGNKVDINMFKELEKDNIIGHNLLLVNCVCDLICIRMLDRSRQISNVRDLGLVLQPPPPEVPKRSFLLKGVHYLMLDRQEAPLVIRGLKMLSLTTQGTRALMNLHNNNVTLLQVLKHVWTTAYSALTDTSPR